MYVRAAHSTNQLKLRAVICGCSIGDLDRVCIGCEGSWHAPDVGPGARSRSLTARKGLDGLEVVGATVGQSESNRS